MQCCINHRYKYDPGQYPLPSNHTTVSLHESWLYVAEHPWPMKTRICTFCTIQKTMYRNKTLQQVAHRSYSDQGVQEGVLWQERGISHFQQLIKCMSGFDGGLEAGTAVISTCLSTEYNHSRPPVSVLHQELPFLLERRQRWVGFDSSLTGIKHRFHGLIVVVDILNRAIVC